jgi:hypothetical protein
MPFVAGHAPATTPKLIVEKAAISRGSVSTIQPTPTLSRRSSVESASRSWRTVFADQTEFADQAEPGNQNAPGGILYQPKPQQG